MSILAVAFILGPIVSTLPFGAFITHPETLSFVARNITLLSVQFHLPGVFETQPYTAIEGSIWTLLYEVLCYVGVFALGVLGFLRSKAAMVRVCAVYLAIYWGVRILDIDLHPKIENLIKLSLPFAVGTAFYVWRRHLPLHWVGILILAGLATLTKGTMYYGLMFSITLGYAVFWAAYAPGGAIRAYNRLGDYSYGIYIYAFPLQGFAVWLWGPQDPWTNIALSLPMVLIPSILSWHYIEKPALAFRRPRAERLAQGMPL